MTKDLIKQTYTDFSNALERLGEALGEDASKNSLILDGTIQRFEFTYELAWKLLKRILENQGVSISTPRQAIKESFRAEIIMDGENWIIMLEDRNATSHIYDEIQAMNIYMKIKDIHYKNLKDLRDKASEYMVDTQ